ncbi:MAG: hypothetical protein ABSH36_04415 [Solirubrobacteraceae bacterium]
MHLASRFLDAALANAAPAERCRILDGCRNLVESHAKLGLGNNAETALADQGLLSGRHHDEPMILLLVEQGLRLASLVHDLGHLPFSHDFEQALEDHWRASPDARKRAGDLMTQGPGGDAVHERIGYALAPVVQRDVFNEQLANGPLGKPAEVALLIARDILDAPAAPQLDATQHAAVLSWLHSLVAGELDVDRADYVLRDVRHYGLTAAGYDLDRLVDHLIPIPREDGSLETAVLARGVSAAESFFVARFRMYTWAVYHHKIQQAAAGLRVAIVDLLDAGPEPLRIFLDDLEAIAGGTQTQETLDRFVDYDDSWWMGLMRDRLRLGVDPAIEPWLALFVRRRPGPVSLWKRACDRMGRGATGARIRRPRKPKHSRSRTRAAAARPANIGDRMTTAALTPARLFADLPRSSFDDYDSFENAFVTAFNAHRWELPSGYSWRDALDWGLRRNIVRRQDSKIVVYLEDINDQ